MLFLKYAKMIRTKLVLLNMPLPFTNSLLLVLLTCGIAVIFYLILSKKYNLFIFIKSN